MKTRDEILATWETEGIYTDWYAIDSYDPMSGEMHRLFVGNESDAAEMMSAYYSAPSDMAQSKFHRCQLVSESDALAYFNGEVDELPDERGVYSATEAAAMLGVSRMRVNQLIHDGKLDARMVGNAWQVYRYSVEGRMAEQPAI